MLTGYQAHDRQDRPHTLDQRGLRLLPLNLRDLWLTLRRQINCSARHRWPSTG
jgi:hypothetical protein